MKPLKRKNSKIQLSQSEPKEVHIRVLIEDDDHGYNELDLVSNTEELTKRIESCRMILDSSGYYLEIVYEELLNRVSRPKIQLDVICNSILNYICCHLSIEKLNEKLIEYGDETIKIVAHVNVETDDYSFVTIVPLIEHQGKIYPPFDILEKSIHKLSLPSRLEFLTEREKVFLFRVVKYILQSGDTCFRTDHSHLWCFFLEQISEQEEINKDCLSGVIATLEFYNFISIEWEAHDGINVDKVVPLEIIVFDLDLYDKYYDLPWSNQAA